MPVLRVPALLVALAVLATTPAAAGIVDTPTCKRELDAVSASVTEVLTRLKSGPKTVAPEQCAAYRRQFIGVVRARAVIATCKTGADREQDIGRLDGAVENINSAIAANCAVD
jgi:hypothetical protein